MSRAGNMCQDLAFTDTCILVTFQSGFCRPNVDLITSHPTRHCHLPSVLRVHVDEAM
jgi:hypothetical protein